MPTQDFFFFFFNKILSFIILKDNKFDYLVKDFMKRINTITTKG